MRKVRLTPEQAAQAAANLQKLPDLCYAADMMEPGKIIVIKKGETGYYRTSYEGSPESFNAQLKVTPEQMEAMIMGSMAGWHSPGADPDTWVGKTRTRS